MANSPTGNIDRRELLPQLFPAPEKWLFVSGLAGAARDAAALTNDGSNLYGMAGTMGAAVPMGLGVALSAPNHSVAVVTGDGEMLMGIGSLVTVAAARPQNLTIICLDNSMHGETGRQTGHTASVANLETIARGSGLSSTLTISEANEITNAVGFITESPGPRFLLVRILPTQPCVYSRDLDLAACRVRFRHEFQARN
ncbi:MAG: thiamine pyrophosphate-dependent enzyme [Alphaproteobacteria bacterium]|nr:thiamine pyrophosphate-dependent enzyme [Alphaproteobacteria bacterium]